MIGSSTNGPPFSVMTIEKLREAYDMIEQPIGHAVMVGAGEIDCVYRLDDQFDILDHEYMLVVPRAMLDEAIDLLGAKPVIGTAMWKFPVYACDKPPFRPISVKKDSMFADLGSIT